MMLRAHFHELRAHRDGERGQAVIVAAIALAALIAIAAYAINTAQWWVHSHHLQEQADAAALAGARMFDPSCTSGSASDQASVNSNIANAVAAYSGSGSAKASDASSTSSSLYNQQLNSNGSAVTAWINSNTFPSASNSTTPNYTTGNLTGNPCADNMLDVKLTEQSVTSMLPSVNPQYLTAEAQVGFYEETSTENPLPYTFENDSPSYMWVELVDENSDPTNNTPVAVSDATAPGNPCTRSNDGINPTTVLAWAYLPAPTGTSGDWTGNLIPCNPLSSGDTRVPFTSSSSSGTFPVGVRVITSAYNTQLEAGASNPYPPQCPMEWGNDHDSGNHGTVYRAWAPNGVICYDVGPPNPGLYNTLSLADSLTDDGASFVRVWQNPSVDTPGYPSSSPAAPQASDVWLVPFDAALAGSQPDQCGTTEGTDYQGNSYSNFFNGAETVQLCANMTWTTTKTNSTSIACSNASMTTYVVPSLPDHSSSSYTLSCPAAGPNGVWYSPGVPLTDAVSSADPNPLVSGPTTFALSWTLKTGKIPTEYTSAGNATSSVSGGYSGSCTSSSPCYGSFDGDKTGAAYAEVVQRAFDGASCPTSGASGCTGTSGEYQYEASYSRAGPIDAIKLTDTDASGSGDSYNGDYVQSIARGTAANLSATVELIPGYKDDTSTSSAGDPVTLNAGDDDFSGEWDCYEPHYQAPGQSDSSADPAWGDPQAFNLEIQYWIEEGCNGNEITDASHTTLPSVSPPVPQANCTTGQACIPKSSDFYWYSIDPSTPAYGPPTCPSTQPTAPPESNPATCVEGVSDNDILWNLMAGLNERILGCTNAQCIGNTPKCNNYWNSNNSQANVLAAGSSNDKRLVTLLLTNYGTMYPSSYEPPPIDIPIIGFAEFYVTGWWGDPCSNATTAASDATTYTLSTGTVLHSGADDVPPNDADAHEAITDNNDVDGNAYTEDPCGHNIGDTSGGTYTHCGTLRYGWAGNSTTCDSSTPGYDTALASDDCTDQGLILGHFVQTVVTTGGEPSNTVCTADSLGICVAVLNK